jgi:hypothetical protein
MDDVRKFGVQAVRAAIAPTAAEGEMTDINSVRAALQAQAQAESKPPPKKASKVMKGMLWILGGSLLLNYVVNRGASTPPVADVEKTSSSTQIAASIRPGSQRAHAPYHDAHGVLSGSTLTGVRVTTIESVWVCSLPNAVDEAYAMVRAGSSIDNIMSATDCILLAAGNDGVSIDKIEYSYMKVVLDAPYAGLKVWTLPYGWGLLPSK